MYCKECKIPFDDDIQFCNQCGAELISDLDYFGLATIQGEDGAFEELYWLVESKVRRYLYHRVPIQNLQKCIEEAYDSLWTAMQNYESRDDHFSQWFNRFLYRYALRYTGLHNIFLEEDIEAYQPKYEQDEIDLRIERDITMGEEKRIDILNYILEGVTEKERICISQHYIEKLKIDMIAAGMHTRSVVIEYHIASGCDKMKTNLIEYQKEFGATLFGMTEMAFIIWIMQYDDLSRAINPKDVLHNILFPAEKQLEVKPEVQEMPEAEMQMQLEPEPEPEETVTVEYDQPKTEAEEVTITIYPEEEVTEEPVDLTKAEYEDEYEEAYEDEYTEEYEQQEEIYGRRDDDDEYEDPEEELGEIYDDYDDYVEEEEESVAIKAGNIILKILIAACLVVLIGLCTLIAMNIFGDDKDAPLESEVGTEQVQSDNGQKANADDKKAMDLATTTTAYENYMEEQKLQGHFYAIIPAGENKEPMLVIAKKTKGSAGDNFLPTTKDQGYDIEGVYVIYKNHITKVSDEIKHGKDLKAWRIYHDKLTSYAGKDKIQLYTIVDGKYKYKRIPITKDYDTKAKVFTLKEFTGSNSGNQNADQQKNTEAKKDNREFVDKTVEVVSEDGYLNIRKGPSVDTEKIGTLDDGDEVDIVTIDGDWGELAQGGWIKLTYTKEVQ